MSNERVHLVLFPAGYGPVPVPFHAPPLGGRLSDGAVGAGAADRPTGVRVLMGRRLK